MAAVWGLEVKEVTHPVVDRPPYKDRQPDDYKSEFEQVLDVVIIYWHDSQTSGFSIPHSSGASS
jgi:hypothetical protein